MFTALLWVFADYIGNTPAMDYCEDNYFGCVYNDRTVCLD